MAKELTEDDKKKIKDSVIASCVAKGIKPTVQTSTGVVPNPLYANCVQLGYDDALKHASQGKLGQWFSKVNSYVQSQGGILALLQGISSMAAQYRGQTPDMGTGTGTGNPGSAGTGQYGTNPYGPNPYGQDPYGRDPYGNPANDDDGDNTSLWIVMIILLFILIVAAAFYFGKGKTKTA